MRSWTNGRPCGHGAVSAIPALLIPGSLRSIQLGKMATLAKLQAEHVRLCLNAMTLRPEIETEEVYLHKAAEAAISTIQTHVEMTKRDHALRCGVDVSLSLGPLLRAALCDIVSPSGCLSHPTASLAPSYTGR